MDTSPQPPERSTAKIAAIALGVVALVATLVGVTTAAAQSDGAVVVAQTDDPVPDTDEPADATDRVAEDVADAEIDAVFERFYRLDRSRTTAGSGLGLSLAAAIVKLHGGTIRLQDRNPGLSVCIELESVP